MLLIVEETESGDSHEVPDTEPGPVRWDHFHCDLDVARLNQPSIATLPDEVHSQSPGLPELLGRRTLRQILRAEGALPSEHAIRIFLATWKALHRVHGVPLRRDERVPLALLIVGRLDPRHLGEHRLDDVQA